MKKQILAIAGVVIAGVWIVGSSFGAKPDFLAGGSGIKPPVFHREIGIVLAGGSGIKPPVFHREIGIVLAGGSGIKPPVFA